MVAMDGGDVYKIDEKIPLSLSVNNKFCSEKVQSIVIKLIRCVKFRIDFGSGQECISKSALMTMNLLPTSEHKLIAGKSSYRQIGAH